MAVEQRPVRVDKAPSVVLGGLLHQPVEPLGKLLPLLGLLLVEGELGIDRHAAAVVGAHRLAVGHDGERWVRRQDDPVALLPRDVQDVVDAAVQRLVALLEVGDGRLRLGDAVHMAEPAAKLLQRRLVGEHGVGDEAGKADVVAADRYEQQVDAAGFLAAAAAQREIDELGDAALELVGGRELLDGSVLRRALGGGRRRNLRILGRLRHPLVALVDEEQTVGDLRAGTGVSRKGHGAVRVLDGELQRYPRMVRVKRAVTGLVEPARILLEELLVADLLPGADARRIALELDAARPPPVVDPTVAGEHDRHVGIALARPETVADADDEDVLDRDIDLGDGRPLRAHRDARAAGIGHLDHGFRAAGSRSDLRHRAALALQRRHPPLATLPLELGGRFERDDDAVTRRVEVIAVRLAAVLVATLVPARLAEDRLRPTAGEEPGEHSFRRLDGLLALDIRQRPPRVGVQMGVGRIEKEAERVLDAPRDFGRGRRTGPQQHCGESANPGHPPQEQRCHSPRAPFLKPTAPFPSAGASAKCATIATASPGGPPRAAGRG